MELDMGLFEEVKIIVAQELKVADVEITPESDFVKDLNADSLDVVELIMSLEDKFNIEIKDEDAEKIKCVKDVVLYIQEHR